MVIIHIYRDRAIFLLFYDDRDTLSTECEVEMSIFELIFTHKNIPKTLWDNDIHTLQNGRKNCDNSSYLWSYIHISTIL